MDHTVSSLLHEISKELGNFARLLKEAMKIHIKRRLMTTESCCRQELAGGRGGSEVVFAVRLNVSVRHYPVLYHNLSVRRLNVYGSFCPSRIKEHSLHIRRMLLRLLQFDSLSSLMKWMNTKLVLRHNNVAYLGNKREINCKRPSNHSAVE